LYAAQRLRGLAGVWWASYTAALSAGHHVPWGEFRTAFYGHHLSAGTMHRKLTGFLDLHQGNRSVYEYIQEFNNLAQYGGHHVDTDAKKAWFGGVLLKFIPNFSKISKPITEFLKKGTKYV
jgi:hypothetical protein